MVQAAAGASHQLRSPIQGRQGSRSHSSMWPVVVLGILTAIFAWIWYRGGGEANEPDSLGQKQEHVVDSAVTPETEQQREPAPRASRESECEPNSSKQEAPYPRLQENNPAVSRRRKERQSKQQVTEKGLCDIQSNAAADTNIPRSVQEEASVAPQQCHAPMQGELQGHVQEGRNDVPEKKELHGDIKEHPTDPPKKEELQAHLQEHPADVPKKEKQRAPLQEHPADVRKKEKQRAPLQEHPADVPKKEKQRVPLQERPADVPKKEKQRAPLPEHPADVPKKEKQRAPLPEHPADVPKKKQRVPLQEHPANVPKKEKQRAPLQEHPADVPKKEELKADLQEHPADVPKREDEQVNILEHQTSVPMEESNLLEEHLEDLVQTNPEESYKAMFSKNEVYGSEVDLHPTDIPETKMLINGDKVYSSLKKGEQLSLEEAYPQDKLGKAVVQANGEARSPTRIVKELEAQKLLHDSCLVSMSVQEDGAGKTTLHHVNYSQDSANEKVNRAKQAAENATGCLFRNTSVENSINVLEAKETLNNDLCLEMVNTSSDDSNAIVADPFLKHESVEKCEFKGVSMCSDTLKPTGLQDDSDVFASNLKKSTQEGLSTVLKLGTGPKTSKKKIAGLGSPNTDVRNTFDCLSEANIHEIDNQKTRKVATIQPMTQNVNFAFKVHYITHSDSQIIAITGDHEKLGKWEAYVPLTCGNGGFWSRSITLPADTNLAWKFVMVENGKINRWEECPNRFMKLAHDDIEAQLWWGFP